MFGSCHQLGITFIGLLTGGIGFHINGLDKNEPTFLLDAYIWRFWFGFPVILSALQILLLLLVYRYESPSFYAKNNNAKLVKIFMKL